MNSCYGCAMDLEPDAYQCDGCDAHLCFPCKKTHLCEAVTEEE